MDWRKDMATKMAARAAREKEQAEQAAATLEAELEALGIVQRAASHVNSSLSQFGRSAIMRVAPHPTKRTNVPGLIWEITKSGEKEFECSIFAEFGRLSIKISRGLGRGGDDFEEFWGTPITEGEAAQRLWFFYDREIEKRNKTEGF